MWIQDDTRCSVSNLMSQLKRGPEMPCVSILTLSSGNKYLRRVRVKPSGLHKVGTNEAKIVLPL